MGMDVHVVAQTIPISWFFQTDFFPVLCSDNVCVTTGNVMWYLQLNQVTEIVQPRRDGTSLCSFKTDCWRLWTKWQARCPLCEEEQRPSKWPQMKMAGYLCTWFWPKCQNWQICDWHPFLFTDKNRFTLTTCGNFSRLSYSCHMCSISSTCVPCHPESIPKETI